MQEMQLNVHCEDLRTLFYMQLGDEPVVRLPQGVSQWQSKSGTHVFLWWYSWNGDKHHLLDNSVFVSGTLEIPRAPRGIEPPRIVFHPSSKEHQELCEDADAYLEEQYRLVGEAVRVLALSECYQTGCPCMQTDAEGLFPHLMRLCNRAVCTKTQLRAILADMF